jgi:NAD(P)-dependent dehydrogenase (short-subunit alcohol dehydrogenase family)
VALITGGDSGIGRAVAVLYAREGADVAIVYLPDEQTDAEETRAAVEKEGRRAVLLAGDVCDPKFCRHAVEETIRVLGKQPSPEKISEEQWEKTFRTNIGCYFSMVKASLQHMGQGTTIINTGSITGLEGSKNLIDYSATKGAIHAFTKSLAQNLVGRKIRVNCVAPGPDLDGVAARVQAWGKSRQARPRHSDETPQPEEVAPAFVFFASEADSSYITGEILTLLGGETRA